MQIPVRDGAMIADGDLASLAICDASHRSHELMEVLENLCGMPKEYAASGRGHQPTPLPFEHWASQLEFEIPHALVDGLGQHIERAGCFSERPMQLDGQCRFDLCSLDACPDRDRINQGRRFAIGLDFLDDPKHGRYAVPVRQDRQKPARWPAALTARKTSLMASSPVP
nr:hypothetical protein [Sphingobium indicum]